jgi:FAD/FMN-containing dehydrogenase
MYENARDDETMSRASRNIISKGTELGKEMGLWHRFLYQNYAGKEQKVFEGYGPENRARLLQIQQRYDPQGVFKRLQPGYFKV